MTVTLVLGGARSGKSNFAERLIAESTATRRIYLATATAGDTEMAERIAHHRARRPAVWQTIEAPLALGETVAHNAAADSALLVDCLTLWLSNLMHAGREVDDETARLVAVLRQAPGDIVLVSNEVGLGLVPETSLGRAFRDAQGRLNQAVAEVAVRVAFIAAGLPLWLKGRMM